MLLSSAARLPPSAVASTAFTAHAVGVPRTLNDKAALSPPLADNSADDTTGSSTSPAVPSTSSGRGKRSPPSTARAFETQNFLDVGKEWEHLKTLRLVFERAGLDHASQQTFLSLLAPRVFSDGEHIVRQGEPGDAFYIITRGEVLVTHNVASAEDAAAAALAGATLTPDRCEVVVTHLYAGHFFGETSLVNDQPRNANVVAAGVVHTEVMSKEVFKPFLESEQKFSEMIGALVIKKEEKQRQRKEVLALASGADVDAAAAPTERNEVKISILKKKGRTASGRPIINGYVLSTKLGRGSYGTVWLARSETTGQKFAMKIVSRALMRKKRFGTSIDDDVLREVAVMKRLSHRNVVKLYEVCVHTFFVCVECACYIIVNGLPSAYSASKRVSSSQHACTSAYTTVTRVH